jgi:predicted GNAT family acetyltransferase
MSGAGGYARSRRFALQSRNLDSQRQEDGMVPEITHDPERRRLQAHVEGNLCVLDYALDGTVMIITHTEVPPAIGGRGIAAALVRAALELARDAGWSVSPACSYAMAWMQRHPEYDDLRAPR